MGVTNYNKQLSVTQIACDDAFNVRLSLTAEPDITANPVDIVLILDRSGSMAGNAFANLKNGAKTFVDVIYNATGGTNGLWLYLPTVSRRRADPPTMKTRLKKPKKILKKVKKTDAKDE